MKEKELRSGFTTGTCAAVAAKAAAAMLLTGRELKSMSVCTPKGIMASMKLLYIEVETGRAVCGVKKDAGDDPDVTNGTLIFAEVRYEKPIEEERIYRNDRNQPVKLVLTGGKGIGMVTRKGLSCPVGKHAINPVPRAMIFKEVEQVCEEWGYEGELFITISIPEGEQLALNTFNSKLGIENGISVLGTSGIVEPMSEQALIDTIQLEIHMKAEVQRESIILTPGNYGETFLKDTLGIELGNAVKCSNFIKCAIEFAAKEEYKKILLTGHIGKLVKVAGGVENTHSRYGDRRMEILWDCSREMAEKKGLEYLKQSIYGANTTEEAVELLEEAGIKEEVMNEVTTRVSCQLGLWAGNGTQVEVILFSLGAGLLGMTEGASHTLKGND